MPIPKILVLPGSTRAGSHNVKLAALAAKELTLLAPGAPFVQFTYAMLPPIPKKLPGVRAQASEMIWMNLPPARVWVYRGR